jgi:hypothetical protein
MRHKNWMQQMAFGCTTVMKCMQQLKIPSQDTIDSRLTAVAATVMFIHKLPIKRQFKPYYCNHS